MLLKPAIVQAHTATMVPSSGIAAVRAIPRRFRETPEAHESLGGHALVTPLQPQPPQAAIGPIQRKGQGHGRARVAINSARPVPSHPRQSPKRNRRALLRSVES
jgi:hypothetical protein